jgi:hypothetical protein
MTATMRSPGGRAAGAPPGADTGSLARARVRSQETRIQHCGRLVVELGGRAVEGGLPGRLSLLFAYPAARRHRSIRRDELIDVLWPSTPAALPDAALRTLLSRLRRALGPGVIRGEADLELSGTRSPCGAGPANDVRAPTDPQTGQFRLYQHEPADGTADQHHGEGHLQRRHVFGPRRDRHVWEL